VGCGKAVLFSLPVAEISLRKGSWMKLRVKSPGPWDAVSPGVRSVAFELWSVASFTRPKVFVFSDLRVSFFDRLNIGLVPVFTVLLRPIN